MAVTATAVKQLRETTGAGMMDCKKALTETDGDMDAAIDWLRKKGLAAAAKKSGRVAAEGLVAVAGAGPVAAMVEVNSETDFVSRNDQFQEFVASLATLALTSDGTVDGLKAMDYPGTGRSVAEELTDKIATIGENMNIRRVVRLSVDTGTVASYVHSAVAPNLGKIGVLVALATDGAAEAVAGIGRSIAMHVAAARPDALSIGDVDPAALERERAVLSEQARASGKPEAIIDKMVEGRLRKYYEEVVLLEQLYVVDGDRKVKAVLADAAQEAGAPVDITTFARFTLGEGIEKEETDLAAEVAAALSN